MRLFLLSFYLHQSSKIKNYEEHMIMFCFIYIVLFRTLYLKVIRQGMQFSVPYRFGHSLWFEIGPCSQVQAICLVPGSISFAAPEPHHASTVSKAQALKSRRHGLKSQLCHLLLAQRFAETFLIFVNLSFLINQMRIITYLFKGCCSVVIR